MTILITKITITYNPALINFSQQMDSNLLFETSPYFQIFWIRRMLLSWYAEVVGNNSIIANEEQTLSNTRRVIRDYKVSIVKLQSWIDEWNSIPGWQPIAVHWWSPMIHPSRTGGLRRSAVLIIETITYDRNLI